jgi:hypothetical protein
MGNVTSCLEGMWTQIRSCFPWKRPAAGCGAAPGAKLGTLPLADDAKLGGTEFIQSVHLDSIPPVAKTGQVIVPTSAPQLDPTAPVDLPPRAPSESSRLQVRQLEGPALSAPTSETGVLEIVEIVTTPSPPKSPSNNDQSKHEEQANRPTLEVSITGPGTSDLARSPVETSKLTNSPESFTSGDSPASRNSLLQDAQNELLLTVPKEQLSEEGKRSASRQSTATVSAPLTPPITLFEFLAHIYPGEVFKKLQLNVILQIRLVNQQFKSLVDDYLRDVILPFTRLIFRFKTPADFDYPDKHENHWEHLVPVIARVDKGHRVFPHGRIVYEPAKRETKKHRLHKFQPYEIEVFIDDRFDLGGERKYTFHLHPPRDENHTRTENSTRHERNHDPRDRGQRRSHLLKFEYTKVHQYYRFDSFDELPVHIFYKDRTEGDSNFVELHCISIPLDFLRREVLRDRDENMKMAKTRARRNRLLGLPDFLYEGLAQGLDEPAP